MGFDDLYGVLEQRRVAAELVDHVAPDAGPFPGAQQRQGADDAGNGAAALDIGDQHHRQIGGFGESHVGDIAGPEVDLGRAAGAFDHHQIGVGGQDTEAFQHSVQQFRF